ncbi:hypothetical protein BJV78DRAFT_1357110 [Lactifluus subvellereus]|nr:hypothetical protein BJV78DRAFT_1357110 [Lactifluus subvellereus]
MALPSRSIRTAGWFTKGPVFGGVRGLEGIRIPLVGPRNTYTPVPTLSRLVQGSLYYLQQQQQQALRDERPRQQHTRDHSRHHSGRDCDGNVLECTAAGLKNVQESDNAGVKRHGHGTHSPRPPAAAAAAAGAGRGNSRSMCWVRSGRGKGTHGVRVGIVEPASA